jgi:predicted metal-dependent peptidase
MTKPTAPKTDEEISKAAFILLLKEPFYAHVLAGIPRHVTERVLTSAVVWNGQQVSLFINPVFFLKSLTPNQRVAAIKHEVLHIVFRHLFRCSNRVFEVEDLAADLVVNQLVSPWPLPKGAVLLDSFPDLKLQPHQTLQQYYDSLIHLYREMQRHGYLPGVALSKAGKCKADEEESASASGVPDWARKTSSPQSAIALDRFFRDRSRGDHSLWSNGADALGSAAGRYAIGSVLIRARERTPLGQWGNMPASLVAELSLIMAERQPKIDWKRVVRIFCASSGRTKIKTTMKRVSKRYGTRPGVKIQRLQRLLVAVDTSGSIDQDMVESFFVEIHGAWRAGASVTVVECDAEVQRSYEYRGQPPSVVHGGGGTAFEPVFLWMRTQRSFDGCLYLTDGAGPAPETRPLCKLLWVVPWDDNHQSSMDEDNPVELPFGRTIMMELNS